MSSVAPRVGSSPRVWGLRVPRSPSLDCFPGSSPRVWGLLVAQAPPVSHPAGHPHACGDYSPGPSPPLVVTGSSPRVWGLLGRVQCPPQAHRVIPTRVGTTTTLLFPFQEEAGHPHACGDYPPGRRRDPGRSGSSPRVWGLRTAPALRGGLPRVIPTRVGTTHRPLPAQLLPRVIPTRVGTTCAGPTLWLRCSGHPHACGDYGWPRGPGASLGGSSPRVWGLPSSCFISTLLSRVIPTRVRTTRPSFPVRHLSSGHPHACGDYPSPSRACPWGIGSSPRVWGLRHPV